jgi:hypothetical protein
MRRAVIEDIFKLDAQAWVVVVLCILHNILVNIREELNPGEAEDV